jgi:hypothetical protein
MEATNNIVQLEFGQVSLENNIVVIVIKPNTIISASKASQMRDVCLHFKPEGNFLCLVYIGAGCSTDSTIMPYVNDPKNTVSKAQAVVLHNSLQVIFMNFYIRVMRNINEVKAFTKREDAIDWLNKKK